MWFLNFQLLLGTAPCTPGYSHVITVLLEKEFWGGHKIYVKEFGDYSMEIGNNVFHGDFPFFLVMTEYKGDFCDFLFLIIYLFK